MKVDLRTISFDIPPQEESFTIHFLFFFNSSVLKSSSGDGSVDRMQWWSDLFYPADSDQRLRDGGCGRGCVLPHTLSHLIRSQCVQRAYVHASPGSDYIEECTWDQKPGRAVIRQGGDIAKYAGETGDSEFSGGVLRKL